MDIGRSFGDTLAYAGWAREHDDWLAGQQTALEDTIWPSSKAGDRPLFTICIIAAAPGPGSHAAAVVRGLREQSFPAWEAFVAAPLGTGDDEGRFRTVADGRSEVEQCQDALDRGCGRYLIVVPPGVLLHRQALWMFAAAVLSGAWPAVVYSDSDRIDPAGHRIDPQLRTGWDPDLMLAGDATGAVVAVRAGLARQAGGFHGTGALDAALRGMLLRVSHRSLPHDIHHVAAVLWHASGWFNRAGLVDDGAVRAMLGQVLREQGVPAILGPAPLLPCGSRLRWPVPSPAPLVSVIVPVRDGADLLLRCADGVLQRTDYPALELLIVDNGSREPVTLTLLAALRQDRRVRVLPYPGPFNYSAMNNLAVRQAVGAVVVLLNNDTDVIGPGWLSELVSHAVRPGIGAVGAKLLYPDGRVQHCGMTTGPNGALMHQFRFADRYDPGPLGELALCRTVLAVTGACLAIRRSVFLEAGGFDEEDFRVAYNDVDLCLRLGDLGYRIVCTPFAELFHLESVTRGQDDTPEKQAVLAAEFSTFRRRWDPLLDNDVFYNPHLVFRWADVRLVPPGARPPFPARGDVMPSDPDETDHGPGPAGGDGPDPYAVLRARAATRADEARRHAHRLEAELHALRLQSAAQDVALRELDLKMAAIVADRGRLAETHRQVLQSTTWKASWPLRRMAGNIPAAARRRAVATAGRLWTRLFRGRDR